MSSQLIVGATNLPDEQRNKNQEEKRSAHARPVRAIRQRPAQMEHPIGALQNDPRPDPRHRTGPFAPHHEEVARQSNYGKANVDDQKPNAGVRRIDERRQESRWRKHLPQMPEVLFRRVRHLRENQQQEEQFEPGGDHGVEGVVPANVTTDVA